MSKGQESFSPEIFKTQDGHDVPLQGRRTRERWCPRRYLYYTTVHDNLQKLIVFAPNTPPSRITRVELNTNGDVDRGTTYGGQGAHGQTHHNGPVHVTLRKKTTTYKKNLLYTSIIGVCGFFQRYYLQAAAGLTTPFFSAATLLYIHFALPARSNQRHRSVAV